ncbi:asparaginase [Nitrogeniibacter mangrovi]|uniref:Asparaginase n=1 Tax=Nitrogeniibacter mangrovi TaxID=2016596 RepID=A0A6C1B009_9RHOO|nr:asparaginase [Nitrogeniibacter mangrovi]QID16713.1 asparaginase [Nitrogeniibacter mangrovi]
MSRQPRVVLLSTGGTIAGAAGDATQTTGYRAGELDAATLLAQVPDATALAHIDVAPLLSLDSKDMSPRHWLLIARTVMAHLARPDCDAVVVTHGTDTLEETAWFLHLILPPGKPVILTAAMRPATALSADGPMNLYQAIAVAASPEAHGKGVLVVMNDRIHAGAEITKTHTRALDAIDAPELGPLGSVLPVRFDRAPNLGTAGQVPIDALDGHDDLPRVDILYVAAGADPDLLAEAGLRRACGVVLALPGDGSLPTTWHAAAETARIAGVRIVRASRVGRGAVSPAPADAPDLQLPGSGRLNPSKARIALMLELATGASALLAHLSG